MEYPKVSYDHLPCTLADGQHYIGQDTNLIEIELEEYFTVCWPLSYDTYHCKGFTIHQKINNGHYIKAAVRYYKERNKLRKDKVYRFKSAYSNLVVFDANGKYVPVEAQKYLRGV